MNMLCRRVKLVGCTFFCGFIVHFIFFHDNSSDSRSSISQHSENSNVDSSNINDDIVTLEPHYFEDIRVNYPFYDKIVKSFRTYEKDVRLSSESEVELQSFEVINKIEYVDYVLGTNATNSKITNTDSDAVSLKHLLSVCIDAAEAGGIQLRSVRRNFDLKEILRQKSSKEYDNPVFVGRNRSHKAIEYTLKNSFPKIKLVSRTYNGFKVNTHEKRFQIHNSSEDVLVPLKNILIWIDPLDAQHEYQNNLLEYVSTMVCVAISGKPIIGVIHQPFQNFTKWGWVGNGFSYSPYPVASEPADTSTPHTIVISTSQANQFRMEARLGLQYPVEVIGANGAGYKALQVTEGRADAYFHLAQIKKWKTCAGDALIRAMNGKMMTFEGRNIGYGDPTRVAVATGIIASIYNFDIKLQLGKLRPDSDS